MVYGRAGLRMVATLVVAAGGDVVVRHLSAQGPDRALGLRPDAEGVKVVEAQGVLVGDSVDLVVWYVVLLAGFDEFLRCVGPFRIE